MTSTAHRSPSSPGPVPRPSRWGRPHLVAVPEPGTVPDRPDPSARPLARRPWLALCPAGTVELQGGRLRDLRLLEPGTPVLLVLDSPWARWRARHRSRLLAEQREMVLLPGRRHPWVVVDATGPAVTRFWRHVAVVPGGSAVTTPLLSVVLGLARRAPWTWTVRFAPVRLVLGRRA